MRILGRAERVADVRTQLGEGPRWDAARRRLLWVDIEGGAVHVFDPSTGRDRAVPVGAMVGAVAPWRGDTVLAALADALAAVDLATGAVRRLAALPHPRPGLRSNDGACDPAGRFWFGTMALDEAEGAGTLYRWDGADGPEPVLQGLTISNGLGWRDGRMVFVDTPTQRVDVLDFDAARGAVSGRRPFAEVPDGLPDGLALDEEGGVWVALHGGGAVRRFTPDGRPDGEVTVPDDEVTACAFAGRRLYVTTRGGLFAAEVAYAGPPAQPFGARSTAPSDADATQAR